MPCKQLFCTIEIIGFFCVAMGQNRACWTLKRAEKAQQCQQLAGDLHVYTGPKLAKCRHLVYHEVKVKIGTPN
jgi:hypothetical protein